MRMRFAGIALIATIVAGGCSQPVSIAQIAVSGDETRLGIVFDSCNASLDVDIAESDEAVATSVGHSRGALVMRRSSGLTRRHISQPTAPAAGPASVEAYPSVVSRGLLRP